MAKVAILGFKLAILALGFAILVQTMAETLEKLRFVQDGNFAILECRRNGLRVASGLKHDPSLLRWLSLGILLGVLEKAAKYGVGA
jgi:hypothetical protein